MKQIHIGVVSNNEFGPDGLPFRRGEIMVKCETLLSDGSEYPIPAAPSFPLADPEGFGVFWVPAVDAAVEIEVEADPENYVTEEQIRYRAALYSDANDIAEEFLTNYPNRKGFKFKSGILMFDDTEAEFLVQFFHSQGHGFELTKDGDVNWTALRDFTAQITRDLIAEASRNVNIKGTNQTTLEGTQKAQIKSGVLAEIDAPKIDLTAGAVQPMVLGTLLLAHFTALNAAFLLHKHSGVTTGPGITGVPDIPLPIPPVNALSAKVFGS